MPNLELITVNSVGYRSGDIKRRSARHIPIPTHPELTDDMSPNSPSADIMLRGGWVLTVSSALDADAENSPSPARSAQEIGILGLGRIGRAIASGRRLGMKILYTDAPN